MSAMNGTYYTKIVLGKDPEGLTLEEWKNDTYTNPLPF